MKQTFLLPLYCTAILFASCTDSGEPALRELSVRTTAVRYGDTDTIRFTVGNSLQAETYVTSCNLRPTFWLQGFQGALWGDLLPINIGPCLDIYQTFIILIPNKYLSEALPLTTLPKIDHGWYRIKIEHRLSGQDTAYYAYSNMFEIGIIQ